jgi:predicted Rossmann-fold nucleotide-binding protein
LSVVEIKNRIWTLNELQRAHAGDIVTAENRGRLLTLGHRSLKFNDGVSLHIATTQPKKIEEMTAPLSVQPKNIVILPAQESLGYWRCDPEESGTYVGNAAGKAIALLDRIFSPKTGIGIEKVRENLIAEGIDPENAVFIVNDTGVAFQRDYRDQPEFAASKHVSGPVAWPGPEFAPVIEAQGGIISFFASLKEMAARMEAEGKPVHLKGFDVATNLLVRLGNTPQETQFTSFTASIPIEFTLDPLSHNGEVLTTQHFMKLRGDDVPMELQDKSIAQIKEDYLRYHGPIAHAMREFSSHAELAATCQYRFSGASFPRPRATIATQDHFLSTPVGQGVIDRVAANADAVVLREHAPETLADWDNNFLSHMDLWCGLLVNKQVCDKSIHGKPVIVVQRESNPFYDRFNSGEMNWDDPKTERDFLKFLDNIDPNEDPWLKLRMLTRFKHEKGMVKQEEHHLFKCVDPSHMDFHMLVAQETAGVCHKRGVVSSHVRESFGEDRRDLFEVFIGGSAGTYAQAYVDAAEELGYWAASQGFHVRTGGGSMGIMGAAARGVFRFIHENPDLAEDTHLSLIQTFSTMRYEGAAVDPDKVETMPYVHLAVESSFDTRMASLFRCAGNDAYDSTIGTSNVIMMGGIGTLQESNRWMQYKEAGVPHMQDNKLIYFNQRQASDTTGRQIRVLDPDIRILPKEIRAAHVDEQFDMAGVQRAIMRQYMEWDRKQNPVVMPSLYDRPSLQL